MTADRGHDWPSSWRSVPLWSIFERVKDRGHPDEEMLSVYRDYGVVKKDSRDDNLNKTAENREIYQLVDDGWFVLNRMKAWQGSVGISPYRGIVSGHYICFRPRHQENPRFLNWLLRSAVYTVEYLRLSRGVRPNQVEIDNDDLRVLPVHLPTLREQQAIADFLDGEAAKIGSLLSKQKKLVAVLREYRSAAIAESVSINCTHIRLKYVTKTVRHGFSPQCESVVADGVTEWGVLKAGCVNGGIFRPYENKLLPLEVDPQPELVVKPGDLLLSRANTRDLVGSAAVVYRAFPRLMLSDKIYALSLDEQRIVPDFAALVLSTPQLRQLIELEATGASYSMQNISQADILNLPVQLPTVDDQRDIVRRLSTKLALVDSLISRVEKLIDVMKERLAGLTSAAVTGQIDIPAIARGAENGLAPREATGNRDL